MNHKTAIKQKHKCRFCGCTDKKACKGGCHWISPDVCSLCEGRLIAEVLNKFFQNNYKLVTGTASGEFLKNRLRTAFICGWEAARKI
jgi:hypothetical protein